jgi:hypothetical protein
MDRVIRVSSKFAINFLALFCILITSTESKVYSEPREIIIEEALLQQLHPVIVSSLRNIFKEKYSQYGCERIVSINERITTKNKDNKARPVDAIHGAKFFEITIVICRPNGENVELILKNDTVNSQYYLVRYNIVPSDKKRSRDINI